MSLHQLAHHVQSAGRGEDKILVHMTPKEVGGLQALAMAHGGSLTINPETGLPEAGFLSSILPMVAGLALGPAGLGMSAMKAALITGAAGTVMTGSLGKGLMMGLGAYGGAGLGAGLSSMGQTAAANAAGATPTAIAPTVANAQTSTLGNLSGMTGAGAPSNIFPSAIPKNVALTTAKPLAFNPAYTSSISTMPTSTLGSIGQGVTAPPSTMSTLGAGVKSATTRGMAGLKDLYAASEAAAPYSGAASLASSAMNYMGVGEDKGKGPPKMDPGMIRPYEYARTVRPGAFDVGAPIYSETPGSSAENLYFDERYTALKPYRAPGPEYAADGGLVALAVGGPVETMSAMNAVGGNMDYPQANLQTALYSNPMMQRPESVNVISPGEGPAVGAYSGEQKFAGGGLSDLGGYSDGGRLLKGPGDGVSDSIPAVIGERQPARLADGEFVIPARIVSELGNGSTEAGAKKLYKMMDRVQNARKKSIGKKKVAVDSRAEKLLPA
jgi:hypothetical protein